MHFHPQIMDFSLLFISSLVWVLYIDSSDRKNPFWESYMWLSIKHCIELCRIVLRMNILFSCSFSALAMDESIVPNLWQMGFYPLWPSISPCCSVFGPNWPDYWPWLLLLSCVLVGTDFWHTTGTTWVPTLKPWHLPWFPGWWDQDAASMPSMVLRWNMKSFRFPENWAPLSSKHIRKTTYGMQ